MILRFSTPENLPKIRQSSVCKYDLNPMPKNTIYKHNTTNPITGYPVIKSKHDNHKNINLRLIKHVGHIKAITKPNK